MNKLITVISVIVLMLCLFVGCGVPVNDANPPEASDAAETQPTQETQEPSEEPSAEASANETDTIEAEPSEQPAEPVDASNLSTDPFSFQLSIDGQVIQFPCAASDLMALGYSLEDKAEDILEDGYMTGALMKLENGNYLAVSVYNNSGSEKKFSECKVDDVSVFEQQSKGQSICISNGLTFGSTVDEVMAIYGTEPDDKFEDGTYLTLTYEKDGDFARSVKFYFENNKVNEIDFQTEEG